MMIIFHHVHTTDCLYNTLTITHVEFHTTRRLLYTSSYYLNIISLGLKLYTYNIRECFVTHCYCPAKWCLQKVTKDYFNVTMRYIDTCYILCKLYTIGTIYTRMFCNLNIFVSGEVFMHLDFSSFKCIFFSQINRFLTHLFNVLFQLTKWSLQCLFLLQLKTIDQRSRFIVGAALVLQYGCARH